MSTDKQLRRRDRRETAWRLCLAVPAAVLLVLVLWTWLGTPPSSPAFRPPTLAWTRMPGEHVVTAWARSGDLVVGVGELGVFFETTATAETWRETPIVVASDRIPAYKDLPAIPARSILEETTAIAVAPNGRIVLAGGLEETADSTIVSSPDRGRSWVRAPLVEAGLLTSVAFGTRMGLATGPAGAVVRSTDRGATWTKLAAPTDLALYSVAIGPDDRAIAVGEQGVVLRSTDSGATWAGATYGTSPLFACAVAAERAWAVGASGRILATRDGGRTFVAEDLPASGTLARIPALTSIAVLDRRDGPVVAIGGEGGLVLVGRGDGAWAETHIPGESGTVLSLLATEDGFLAATDTHHIHRAVVTVP